MAFDFQGANPYLSDETQKLLDFIMQQSRQAQLAQTEQAAQPVQQPVEPPDTKQQIDDAVLQGANPQRPSYLLPQAPNSMQTEYQNAILANKLAYAAKEQDYKAAQDEAQRQSLLGQLQKINKAANSTRAIGNAAGLDLSAVGEGVSLQDAVKNLATQRARDLMQVRNGRYSMTTDQFYESEYDRHRMSGASDETARRRRP